jgi:hypothetical protein
MAALAPGTPDQGARGLGGFDLGGFDLGATGLGVLDQDGTATRGQLLRLGLSPARLSHRVGTGQWQRAYHGVYVLFSGPVPPRTRLWAAILAAGEGAAAGPRASLWLAGACDTCPSPVDVVVPARRRTKHLEHVRLSHRVGLATVLHPVARPPRLRVEAAALDLCARLDRPDEVVGVVTGVIQRRLTTAARLRAELETRTRYRWRTLLAGVLADAEHNVQSALEHRWLNGVQRPHGLPRSVLNKADDLASGRCEYRDVEFEGYPLVVELDGREWHLGRQAFRDRHRDNRVTLTGRHTLRYGWHEIAHNPCDVAAEVAAVLRTLGWKGTLRPCGPGCRAGALLRGRRSRG